MDIKALSRSGMSIRAIARHTGLSRTTVRKALSTPVPKAYGPRKPKPSLLDPFLSYLEGQIQARPWARASKLFEELVERGYAGCYENVKRWARSTRRVLDAKRRATVRFETGPGIEAQFDWKGPVGDLIDDRPDLNVFLFRLVFCWSRRRFTRAVTTATLSAVLSDLRDIFEAADGLPKRMVFDNFKAAVLSPRPKLRLHPFFRDFCEHYGVEPAPAIIYSPERKGKIERSFADLRTSEILERRYRDLAAFQAELTADDERHAARVHTTTGATPSSRFEREREFLSPLPPLAFDPRLPETRRVISDCTISYRGAAYSVPWRLVGSTLTVKADPRLPHIDVYDADALVASHTLVAKGQRSILEDHVGELRRARWDRVRDRRPEHANREVIPTPAFAQLVSWPVTPVAERPIEDYERVLEVAL